MNGKAKLRQAKQWLSAHRKQITKGFALALLLGTGIVTIGFVVTYSHYAALLDKQLASQSLMMPAGIYAAPRRISIGESLTREDLIERLQRAGYQEGEHDDEFSAGSFRLKDDGLEIFTNDVYRNKDLPAKLHISFKQQAITRIQETDNQQRLAAILLPAEMLTADMNMKKQVRSVTSFEEIPQCLIQALCAIEDRDFFSHNGVDCKAMFRALYRNFTHGSIREGGSTITQQLIKNQFLSPERTYQRKIAEVMMAMALERRLSKQQIFALYCDRVYLGQSGITSIYGFKQAARVFFGKDLKDISTNEAALLAGLVKAPNRYSPQANLQDALARRDLVFNAMVEAGYIQESAVAAMKNEHLAFLPPQKLDNTAAPYFIDYVKRELGKQRIDEDDAAHLRVETTLDIDLQQVANETVAKHLETLSRVYKKRQSPPEAALIALDPHSGEILAMVGGRDYASSQLNRVTDAMRQPGSVFKPIIYAAAMSKGISPMTTFVNAPHEIQYAYHAVYKPKNFGGSYSNQPVTLREAIVRSLNVVAVDAAMRVGLGNVAAMAGRMGLEQPHSYPSMALGTTEASPLEIGSAYTTFANDGTRVEPQAIRYINANGSLVATGAAKKMSVLSPQTAYVVTNTLEDVVNRGTAARIRKLGFRGAVAGKTGTSRDAWFVGYTPNLLVVVWVGFDDNSDLNMTGGEAAVPIWTEFVQRAMALHPDLAADQFAVPAGLVTTEIDPDTGLIANEYCPRHEKVTLPSFLLPGECYVHQAPVVETANREDSGDLNDPLDEKDEQIEVDSTTLPTEEIKVPIEPEPPGR